MGLHHSKHTDEQRPTAGQWLSQHTFEEALPKERIKMRIIPAGYSVGQALKILHGDLLPGAEPQEVVKGAGAPILSAPIISKQHGTDLGLFDVMDAVKLLNNLAVVLRQGHVEEFNTRFFDSPAAASAGIHPSDVVLPFSPKATLLEVASGMLRVGAHRVCEIYDPSDAKSPIVAILAQSQLMAFLAEHLDLFEPNPNIPLSDTKHGKKRQVFSVTEQESTLTAFEMMGAMNVSAIPVTRDGKLVNAISASNVRVLTKENVNSLLLPVGQFLEQNKLSQGNSCKPSTSIKDAVGQMTKFHLHRLWVVDDDNVVINVLTVGDIIRRFYDIASRDQNEKK